MKALATKITALGISIAILFANIATIQVAQAVDLGTFINSSQQTIARCTISAGKAVVGDIVKQAIKVGIGVLLNAVVPGLGSIFGGGGLSRSDIFRAIERQQAMFERCLARGALDDILDNFKEIVRKRGPDGAETFITNWREFQLSSKRRGEEIFRVVLANATSESSQAVCDYLKQGARDAYSVLPQHEGRIASNLLNPRVGDRALDQATRCTLPEGFTLDKLSEDFVGAGGWDTVYKLFSEPQNNPSGLQAILRDEMNRQVATVEDAEMNEVIANQGFRGVRGETKESSCLVPGLFNTGCLVYAKIKTPGTTVSNIDNLRYAGEVSWVTIVDEKGELLVKNIGNRLIARIFDDTEEASDYNVASPPPVCDPVNDPEFCDTTSPLPSTSPPPQPNCGPGCECKPTGGPGDPAYELFKARFQYLDELSLAIDRVQDRARAGEDVGLNPGNPGEIAAPGDVNAVKFHAAVINEMRTAGFTAQHDGEEVNMYRSGDNFQENSDISALRENGTGFIRRFIPNAICIPPQF
ncbi:MAG: hypothetical protein AAB608_02910 [Patescibacteria group bacterium]|mgnify:CR=1 FL=1